MHLLAKSKNYRDLGKFPGNGIYKAQRRGGGTIENSSNNSTPATEYRLYGRLCFIKIDELQYALLVHRSSQHLIVLGRLIESLFVYRWQDKLALENQRLRFWSTRSVFIEQMAGSLVCLSDICEPALPQVKISRHALIALLNKVQHASLTWLANGCFPREMIIDIDTDFAARITALFDSNSGERDEHYN